MGLGLQGAYGLQGAQQSLQELLASRVAAQKQAQLEQQQALENAQRDRQLTQGDRRMDLDEEVARTPKPQGPVSMSPGGALVDPSTGRIITQIPDRPEKPQGPMIVSPGAQLVDPATGRVISRAPTVAPPSMGDELAEYEAKKQIDAKYTGARPSLGAERNTLNYFNRMLQAEKDARAVEDLVGEKDVAIADIPLVPSLAENLLRSESGQKYTQAQRAYTEARLRKESGAAIPESEFTTDRKTNFRTFGDKPDTIKQKRNMRLQTLRGIGNAAGRAFQEYYGDDATLDSILKDFVEAQAAEGQGPAVGEPRTINGVPAVWDGQGWLPAKGR